MSKVFCERCGALVDTEDLTMDRDYVGECWGQPAYETVYVCPHCGYDDFVDAVQCDICGEWVREDEITDGGICTECAHQKDDDIDFWYQACENDDWDKEPVYINGLLASMFTEEEINSILLKALKEAHQDLPDKVNCKKFVSDNIEWASEIVAKEEKENA